MGKKEKIKYRNRLDKVFAEFDTPPVQLLDRQGKPLKAGLQVTNTDFEPGAGRYIYAYSKSDYGSQQTIKQIFFANYDEATRLSPEFLKEQAKLGLEGAMQYDDGRFEYGTRFYDSRGYLLVEKGNITKIGDQFYFNQGEGEAIDFAKKEPYMPGIAPNLYKVGDKIFQQEGELYYTYPNKDEIYTEINRYKGSIRKQELTIEGKITDFESLKNIKIVQKNKVVEVKKMEGYRVFPIKNQAVEELYPFTNLDKVGWDRNQEPNPINPSDSERAFRLQMKFPELAATNQKRFEVTLTSTDPVTHEPLDKIKVVLRLDKNAKEPGVYVSEPLALSSHRDNKLNGAVNDQLVALAGSQLVVSYNSIEGKEVQIPIGGPKAEATQEINLVVFKDGNEEASLKLAQDQLFNDVASRLAPMGIAVKVNVHFVEKPTGLNNASPEKLAAIAKGYASSPNAITMIMGGGNHGTVYHSVDPQKNVRNSFFVDQATVSNGLNQGYNVHDTEEMVMKMMLTSSGYLEPGKEYRHAEHSPNADRAKYYLASPTLDKNPTPSVVVDPFTAKPALVP
ncbi:MAG: hypothetical protein R3F23_00685 [Verrucomicrobiia bacterium]